MNNNKEEQEKIVRHKELFLQGVKDKKLVYLVIIF